MDIDPFVELVRSMRNSQRIYFANRSNENLVIAKQLEQKVDALLKTIPEPRDETWTKSDT